MSEMDNNINLEELKKRLEERRAVPTPTTGGDDETPVVGSNLAEKLGVTPSAPVPDFKATPVPADEDKTTYTGPGIIVESNELTSEEEKLPKFTGITPDTQSSIDSYLASMDSDIETLKKETEQIKTNIPAPAPAHTVDDDSDDESEESESQSMTKDEFMDKYNEAIVVIDKTGFGRVVNFTEEEHEKLEKVRKIKLEEVENISLDSIKTKKPKKKDIEKIIKRVTNIATTNIVLPISGYTAEMKGCSAYELISLIDSADNALLNAQNKWSLIHSKLENTSLGKMDFNEFLLNTAATDYNTFIYGLLCSTYPDDDEMPLTCEKCKKPFNHKYSVRSLIRAEGMSDKLKDVFMHIVDSSVSAETAKQTHRESLISYVKRVKLPYSGIIAEIYVQSAYDLINKSIKDLTDNTDEKYKQTAVLATLINAFYIPDPDEDGSYFEVSESVDISKTIYTLNEVDVLVIRKIGEELLSDMSISYGLMDVKCPHCGNYIPFIEMELENILFYRYRQALNTAIE